MPSHQKHLRIALVSKLNFNAHVDQKLIKTEKYALLDDSQSIVLEMLYLQYINLL